jgi:4-amino-4-deoxy-L-arabinose transferase-like glycosyltransferase
MALAFPYTRRALYYAGLALAVALLLATRLPLVRCGVFGSDVPNFNDEVNYVNLAHSLGKGDTIADTMLPWTRAPATAYALLLLSRLRGLPPEFAVCDFQRLQVALWCGLLLLTAAIARRLLGRRVALVTALLVAITPEIALLSLLVYAETLFCVGLLVALAALLAYHRSQRFVWLAVAGVAAGLGALARSAMLPLLPVLALSIFDLRLAIDDLRRLRPPRLKPHISRLVPCLVFIACCALTIAPWTLRNYRLYGGLILIDTSSAFMLWTGNTPASRDEVAVQIEAFSSNPAERQRFAMQQARAEILGDPGRFAAKVTSESVGAWAPREFTVRRDFWVDFLQRPLLGTLLAQLDTLLTIALPLALLGLLFAPATAPGAQQHRIVVVGLALAFTLTMAITHFEGRYRTPFLLALLPYSAWCLAHPVALLRALRRPGGYLALALIAVLAVVYAPNLWPAQWQSAGALALHGSGLLREGAGDAAGALEDQRAAYALDPTLRDSAAAAGRILLAQGDLHGAESALRPALAEARRNVDDAPDLVVLLQRVLLAQGRAREADDLDHTLSIPDRRRAEALAWGNGLPATGALRLGQGDFGLLDGFYIRQREADTTFRWSRPGARALLVGAGESVCLRLSAARPLDVPAPVLTLSASVAATPQALGSIQLPRQGWTWGCVPAPRRDPGQPFELRLEAPSYNPYLYEQGSDTRELGVAVSAIELRSGALERDAATGLLLDRPAASAEGALRLMGATGNLGARPGDLLPLTLWWRADQPPPAGAFTFLHLLDAGGATVAAYNAPLAAGQLPAPWVAAEPLADQTALPLPATLAPGTYRLEAGAFDPVSGAVLARADLGQVEVR